MYTSNVVYKDEIELRERLCNLKFVKADSFLGNVILNFVKALESVSN
jgi:hypothetical protein